MTHDHFPLWTPGGYRATCTDHWQQPIAGPPGEPGELIPGDVPTLHPTERAS